MTVPAAPAAVGEEYTDASGEIIYIARATANGPRWSPVSYRSTRAVVNGSNIDVAALSTRVDAVETDIAARATTASVDQQLAGKADETIVVALAESVALTGTNAETIAGQLADLTADFRRRVRVPFSTGNTHDHVTARVGKDDFDFDFISGDKRIHPANAPTGTWRMMHDGDVIDFDPTITRYLRLGFEVTFGDGSIYRVIKAPVTESEIALIPTADTVESIYRQVR